MAEKWQLEGRPNPPLNVQVVDVQDVLHSHDHDALTELEELLTEAYMELQGGSEGEEIALMLDMVRAALH